MYDRHGPGVIIQLAFGLVLAGSPSVGGKPPSVVAVPPLAPPARQWVRHPAPRATPAALLQTRFSRRVVGPRVERGAPPPGARPELAPRAAWTALDGAPDPVFASPRRPATLQRGPPAPA